MEDDPVIDVVELGSPGEPFPASWSRVSGRHRSLFLAGIAVLAGLGLLVASRSDRADTDVSIDEGERIGSTATGELLWFPDEQLVRLVTEDGAEVVATGGPFVGGGGWLATVVCDNPTPTCSVDAYEPDLGSTWSVRVPIGWTVVQALDRRAVLARGGAVEGALLLDVDARELRPLDVPTIEGATLEVSGRYLVYPANGGPSDGRCAIDLRAGEAEWWCADSPSTVVSGRL